MVEIDDDVWSDHHFLRRSEDSKKWVGSSMSNEWLSSECQRESWQEEEVCECVNVCVCVSVCVCEG